ncbi:hypothetical protein GCK72_009290 [Caenorhabditis remanei]|uniref:Uncharacterized protein n=1 Tax=Caenorhabditis remanei TaxID=31234 RepID=A0A6A5H2M3_CAERE|nr:hypothetical protein GCK72_009288 [Caenorhabditis remanei]XP_053586879.1 hypothetical protein GCK72_009290 [Caenorhabditis remanei]KAF1761034.1 hypothetical protein GCK72_009288 [Caenorhabditis remanei]KAF1761036.1 hypothetical protein GCK72_009290 [Caenorhabditis remanei]
MSFALFLTPPPPSGSSIPSESCILKQRNFNLARHLLMEVSRFVDHQVDVQKSTNPTRPRLPSFFVKTFNYLKSQETSLKYVDSYLNILPHTIQMQLLTEFGPSEDYPKLDEKGYFIETPIPLLDQIVQLEKDVIDYVTNAYKCTGKVLDIPHSFYKTYDRLVGESKGVNEEMKRRILGVTGNILRSIIQNIGNQIDSSYFSRSTFNHLQLR